MAKFILKPDPVKIRSAGCKLVQMLTVVAFDQVFEQVVDQVLSSRFLISSLGKPSETEVTKRQ